MVLKADMRYYAWTFDPDAYHQWLLPQVIRDGRLDRVRLAAVAENVAKSGRFVVDNYLLAMRIDRGDPESWGSVFRPADDAEVAHLHYLIALGSQLVSAPSLGRGDAHVLQALLARAGWSSAQSLQLVRGDPTQSLVDAAANEGLSRSLGHLLADSAGWLSADSAVALLARFSALEPLFAAALREIENAFAPEWRAALADQEIRTRCEATWTEIMMMLSAAVDARRALRLVADP